MEGRMDEGREGEEREAVKERRREERKGCMEMESGRGGREI